MQPTTSASIAKERQSLREAMPGTMRTGPLGASRRGADCIPPGSDKPARMLLWVRTVVVSSWTLASRVLGLIRDRILAGAFGGSLLLDAFLLAFALPNLFRNLFGEGALSAAFLPRYVQLRERDPAAGEAFAGLVVARLGLLLSVIAAGGMVLAATLMLSDSRQTAVVAALALPQLPYLVFICVTAVLAGVLNGRRHFAAPAAAPVLLNIVLIVCVLIWEDVYALPYAVLGAGLLQLALILLALRATPGGVPRARLASTPPLRELRGALLPVLLATGVHQINALLDSIIAYVLVPGAGAVAYLFFANRLFQFPMALVAHGVGTAAYPELASAAGRGWGAGADALREAGSLLLILLLPAAVGLFLVAEPLVRTIYQTGAFGEEAVLRCSLATQMFALALVPAGFAKLFVRVFHAHREQRVPLVVSLVAVAVNLTLNLILVQTVLLEAGLALATACSSLSTAVVLALLLQRRRAGACFAARTLCWAAGATLLMGILVWGLLALWSLPPDAGTLRHGLRLAAAVTLGGAAYAAVISPLARQHRRRAATQLRP